MQRNRMNTAGRISQILRRQQRCSAIWSILKMSDTVTSGSMWCRNILRGSFQLCFWLWTWWGQQTCQPYYALAGKVQAVCVHAGGTLAVVHERKRTGWARRAKEKSASILGAGTTGFDLQPLSTIDVHSVTAPELRGHTLHNKEVFFII